MSSNFDINKWKKLIVGNVEMVQQRVDQSSPHHVIFQELDDLKVMIGNSFEQMHRSFVRHLDSVKDEATQFSKAILSKEQLNASFVKN